MAISITPKIQTTPNVKLLNRKANDKANPVHGLAFIFYAVTVTSLVFEEGDSPILWMIPDTPQSIAAPISAISSSFE
jgi:hypothetical protein